MADTADQIRVEILATAAQFRTELDSAIRKLAGPGGLKDAVKDIPKQIAVRVDIDTGAAKLTLENFDARVKLLKENVRRGWEVGDIEGVNRSVAELHRIEAAAKDAKDAVRDIHPSLLQRAGGFGGGIGGQLFGSQAPSIGPVPLAALPALAPIGLGLAGGATSILGSAAGGILGAGALSVGGIGALVTGLGSVLAVAKPAIAAIGEVTKAQDALTKATENYGAGSKQARQAQQNLNTVIKEAGPGAAAASAALQHLDDAWKAVSEPAKTVFFKLLAEGLKTIETLLPTVAQVAKTSLEAIKTGLQPVFAGLQSAGFRAALTELGSAFAKLAPPLIQAFANIFHSLMLVAIAAVPFVVQIAQSFLKLSQGWLANAQNGAKLRELIGDLVSQTKSWSSLAGALGRLLTTIFSAGASQGQSMVDALTRILTKWNAWLNTTAGQASLKKFFADSRALIDAVFTAIGRLGPVLALMLNATAGLMPIVTQGFRVLADAIRFVVSLITKVSELFGGAKVAGDLLGGALVVLAAAWAVGKIELFIGALGTVITVMRSLFLLIATNPIGALIVGLGIAAAALSGAFSSGQHKAKVSADDLNAALSRQAEELRTLRGLANEDKQSKLSVEEAFTQVKVAKSTLGEDQKRHASSLQIRQDIEAVKQAELDAAKAVEANRQQEQKSYEARKNAQPINAAAIKSAQGRVATLKDEIHQEELHWASTGKSAKSDEHLQHLHAQLKTAEQALANATRTSNETIALTTEEAMKRAGHAVVVGIGDINAATYRELKGLVGATTSTANTAAGDVLKFLSGKAGGGYIGQPSERGHDEVPILVGRGEAVLHAGHQAVVNEALAASGWSGGLAEVFSKTGGLHYNMAGGGFAGGWRSAVASAESLGGTGYQGNPIQSRGYSELSVPPSVANAGSALGHLPYLTRMRIKAGSREVVAAKQDIGAGSSFNPVMGLYPGTVADLGLSGGEFHVLIERADGQPLTAGAAGAVAAAIQRIATPAWKGPGGAVGAVGKAALGRATAAANAVLSSFAPATGAPPSTAAGGAPTGGGFDPNQLGTFDGLRVAKWIIPELQYARAHGWGGHITSGYRAGFDPHAPGGSMHALDIYPGGAVDFGGMVDAAGAANASAFRAATAGYTGKRLLSPIGFRDDGHMSGTGHAAGGFVGGHAKRSATARPAKTHNRSSHPPPAPGRKRAASRAPKGHAIHVISAGALDDMPADVLQAARDAAAAADEVSTEDTRYHHLLDAQQLVPTDALVTLSDADVAFLDPGSGPWGQSIDAKGQLVDSPKLHYQPGDQLVNTSGIVSGRFFTEGGAITGGAFHAGIATRTAQIGALLEPLGREKFQLLREQSIASLIEPREFKAVAQKERRRKRITDFLTRSVARAKRVKAEIAAITTGDLKRNLAQALSHQAIGARKADLQGHLTQLRTDLTAERHHQAELIPIEKDASFAQSLQGQVTSVQEAMRHEQQLATAASSSASVRRAREALLKNSLKGRLQMIEGENKALGGQAAVVGTGGLIGVLSKQIDALSADEPKWQTDYKTATGAIYDVGKVTAELVAEQLALNGTTPIQVRSPSAAAGPSEKDAKLLELQEQISAGLRLALEVSRSQFDVFKGFAPLLQGRLVGSFAQGIDRVARSGPAMVHAGEVILPDPDGPFGNAAVAQARAAGAGPVGDVVIVMANNDEPLMRVIDARMRDRSLRVVTDRAGRRSRLMAGVAH